MPLGSIASAVVIVAVLCCAAYIAYRLYKMRARLARCFRRCSGKRCPPRSITLRVGDDIDACTQKDSAATLSGSCSSCSSCSSTGWGHVGFSGRSTALACSLSSVSPVYANTVLATSVGRHSDPSVDGGPQLDSSRSFSNPDSDSDSFECANLILQVSAENQMDELSVSLECVRAEVTTLARDLHAGAQRLGRVRSASVNALAAMTSCLHSTTSCPSLRAAASSHESEPGDCNVLEV